MAAENTFIGRIAYNNGTKVGSALNTGNISLAVNNSVNFNTLNWCASCGVCNEYTIIADSYFMGKTTLVSVQPLCYCTNSTDLNVLLASINKIASTKFEGPFANLESAMTWIEDNGLFITNQNYPPIVTDGNVLHLDGGLPASYPLVGTSWYDLTENSNNSVLINGVTYNSSSKGYLEFDGSNQYVSVTGTTNIPIGSSNYTIGVWFNADTLGSKGLVGWGNYGTSNEANAFRLTSNGLVNYWWLNDLTVTTTITPGNWYYAVATFDGTTRSIYVNGSLVGSDTPTGHNVTTSGNLTVGVTNSNEYFDGDIGDVQIFDRAITSTEILQNYNSFVKRYNGTNTEICLTPIYCDITPTPTNTPTISVTPSNTPTISVTPSNTGTNQPTPTPTPSPTSTPGDFSQLILGTNTGIIGWDSDTLACQNTSTPRTVYVSQAGITSFQQAAITYGLPLYSGTTFIPANLFDGNSKWFKSIGGDEVFQVDSDGAMSLFGSCPTLTPTLTSTPTNTPTISVTPSNTPTISVTPSNTGTNQPTPTPTNSCPNTIFTHGAIRFTCGDYCNTNYLIQTTDCASEPYGALSIGDFIYGYAGQSGYLAYSNVSTDTATGPFRIADIDGTGEILGIYVCNAGSCIPL
jgi:hypothetical protein